LIRGFDYRDRAGAISMIKKCALVDKTKSRGISSRLART
jgi:hypothetical protein